MGSRKSSGPTTRVSPTFKSQGLFTVGKKWSFEAIRIIWILIYFVSFSVFVFQAVLLVQKFNRNEKIVDIEVRLPIWEQRGVGVRSVRWQLRFEAAPFPAITLCNLNPYKGSETKKAKMISRIVSHPLPLPPSCWQMRPCLQMNAFETTMHKTHEEDTKKGRGRHRRGTPLNDSQPHTTPLYPDVRALLPLTKAHP